MKSEDMAFLSPRSFVEIKRDDVARAYAILKEEDATRLSDLLSFPSPKSFVEMKRDAVAWVYALLTEETSRTK